MKETEKINGIITDESKETREYCETMEHLSKEELMAGFADLDRMIGDLNDEKASEALRLFHTLSTLSLMWIDYRIGLLEHVGYFQAVETREKLDGKKMSNKQKQGIAEMFRVDINQNPEMQRMYF